MTSSSEVTSLLYSSNEKDTAASTYQDLEDNHTIKKEKSNEKYHLKYYYCWIF